MSDLHDHLKKDRTLGSDERFVKGSELYQAQVTQGGKAFLDHVNTYFLEQFEQFMNLAQATTDRELAARYWRLRGILDCRGDQQHYIEYATSLARALMRKRGMMG